MPNFLNKSFLLAEVQGIAAAARRLSNLQQLRFASWLFSDASGTENPKIPPRPSFREQNAETNRRNRINDARYKSKIYFFGCSKLPLSVSPDAL
jgi:hypothetical protein